MSLRVRDAGQFQSPGEDRSADENHFRIDSKPEQLPQLRSAQSAYLHVTLRRRGADEGRDALEAIVGEIACVEDHFVGETEHLVRQIEQPRCLAGPRGDAQHEARDSMVRYVHLAPVSRPLCWKIAPAAQAAHLCSSVRDVTPGCPAVRRVPILTTRKASGGTRAWVIICLPSAREDGYTCQVP